MGEQPFAVAAHQAIDVAARMIEADFRNDVEIGRRPGVAGVLENDVAGAEMMTLAPWLRSALPIASRPSQRPAENSKTPSSA